MFAFMSNVFGYMMPDILFRPVYSITSDITFGIGKYDYLMHNILDNKKVVANNALKIMIDSAPVIYCIIRFEYASGCLILMLQAYDNCDVSSSARYLRLDLEKCEVPSGNEQFYMSMSSGLKNVTKSQSNKCVKYILTNRDNNVIKKDFADLTDDVNCIFNIFCQP